jgi:hypothetical protein
MGNEKRFPPTREETMNKEKLLFLKGFITGFLTATVFIVLFVVVNLYVKYA